MKYIYRSQDPDGIINVLNQTRTKEEVITQERRGRIKKFIEEFVLVDWDSLTNHAQVEFLRELEQVIRRAEDPGKYFK